MAGSNNSQPSDPEQDDGLSVLDLANLPPAQYKVMRILLRQADISYGSLRQAAEADEISGPELDVVLKELAEQQWLIKSGDRYKANLRRKASRILSEFQPPRRQTSTLRGIWDSLENTDETPESDS